MRLVLDRCCRMSAVDKPGSQRTEEGVTSRGSSALWAAGPSQQMGWEDQNGAGISCSARRAIPADLRTVQQSEAGLCSPECPEGPVLMPHGLGFASCEWRLMAQWMRAATVPIPPGQPSAACSLTMALFPSPLATPSCSHGHPSSRGAWAWHRQGLTQAGSWGIPRLGDGDRPGQVGSNMAHSEGSLAGASANSPSRCQAHAGTDLTSLGQVTAHREGMSLGVWLVHHGSQRADGHPVFHFPSSWPCPSSCNHTMDLGPGTWPCMGVHPCFLSGKGRPLVPALESHWLPCISEPLGRQSGGYFRSRRQALHLARHVLLKAAHKAVHIVQVLVLLRGSGPGVRAQRQEQRSLLGKRVLTLDDQ